MSTETNDPQQVEAVWREYLTTGSYVKERRQRHIFKMLPGHKRCKSCYAPFDGLGSGLARVLYGKRPSILNPHICNFCEDFARKHQGGAEIELSLLFVDVRGSTALAEGMSPTEFSHLINRFYNLSAGILVKTDALIDKIIGDQVAGMYVPGYAGREHARQAVLAAQDILRESGHGQPGRPWIPMGVGVHTGIAFVGAVGSPDGTTDITVLGDAANTAARLSAVAGTGEILISAEAAQAAGLSPTGLEVRSLELKGKAKPVTVYVLNRYDSLA